MKNAEQPSSVNARAAARQTETYETSVLDARTTGTRGVGGNLAMGASRLYSDLAGAADAPGPNRPGALHVDRTLAAGSCRV